MRYDGIRAQVKNHCANIELPRGFSRNLIERSVNIQTEEFSSYKYYNFISFLINNGINIENVKENIILLKSIDNFK